ncbi:hypothetical protein MGA3_05655 [Bacillus methanolicus MGA3]|uniref:Mobilization protein n=1 Tax=Bacillus methanolicus (strain MGA3 / ATCC 53907) TaxID=796606 RepID=I3E871_BACMM|nr:hypothetical protein BMMGA3_07795 [Bacillus methanolicus MGA3]EIJ82692.1 hypothetical protein MGA3_05655 [Bacillus methanolicus MGA3]
MVILHIHVVNMKDVISFIQCEMNKIANKGASINQIARYMN